MAVTQAAQPMVDGSVSTRTKLLAAAADLFAVRGYERASLADIARAAGLTTGAVYSAFGSKWSLLRAVVAEHVRGLALPEPTAARSGAEQDLGREADRLAASLHGLSSDPRATQLAILQLEIELLGLRNPALLEDLISEARQEQKRLAAQLHERSVVSGHRLPLGPEDTAVVLAALAAGLQLQQLSDPSATSLRLYRKALKLVLGIADRPAAPDE